MGVRICGFWLAFPLSAPWFISLSVPQLLGLSLCLCLSPHSHVPISLLLLFNWPNWPHTYSGQFDGMPAFVHLPTYSPTCSWIYLTIWLAIHLPIHNTSACLLVIYASVFIPHTPYLIYLYTDRPVSLFVCPSEIDMLVHT